MTLVPELTRLDRQVLKSVPRLVGVRAHAIVEKFADGETAEILSGLEHLGYVAQRNGWWRRTELGQRVLEASDPRATPPDCSSRGAWALVGAMSGVDPDDVRNPAI
jgi:hypothetical protein